MPILGTIASQVPANFQNNSFESIATIDVGAGGASGVTFSSVPGTYKHLQVRSVSRTTRNDASVDGIYMRLNGDTSGNYSTHFIMGDGSTASVNGYANYSIMLGTFLGADAQTAANVFTASIYDILDYANTNKYKTTRSSAGYDSNSVGGISLSSGSWRSTNAVTSITLLAEGSFVQYSSFGLYGIKG
jgi:hypothetical protein